MTEKDDRDDRAPDAAHTELRPAGAGRRGKAGPDDGKSGARTLKPRSRTLPEGLEDDPGEDDPFNDMPV